MKTIDKKHQITRVFLGALLFTLLGLSAACSGGGGQTASTDNAIIDGQSVVSMSSLSPSKVALCDEVNGWEDGCKFVGMKLLKQTPEEIIPLTEEYGRRGPKI